MDRLIAWLFILAISLLLVGSVGSALRLRLPIRLPARRLPYRRRDTLLTEGERRFYEVLRAAAGSTVLIFAQVRLADLLYVPKDARDRQSHLGRITSKHVDFVLCDPRTLVPLVALELDDASHRTPQRRDRDAFVNAAFEAAGLPLLRVPVQRVYDVAELTSLIAQHTGLVSLPQRRASRH